MQQGGMQMQQQGPPRYPNQGWNGPRGPGPNGPMRPNMGGPGPQGPPRQMVIIKLIYFHHKFIIFYDYWTLLLILNLF